MIPLSVPNLSGNEAAYLQACIETEFVSSMGPFVDKLEQLAAVAAGAPHAFAAASGTAGLHVALTALGVGPGDLVILPSYTFAASAASVAHSGARPWLMDVRREDLCLDPALMSRHLVEETERDADGRLVHKPTGARVAAVMPVHALGHPADMDPIVATARDYGLPVVADGAAALGALYKERLLGEMGADLTVMSMNGNKTFTAGGGGVVFCDDAEIEARIRHLATTARIGPGYDHDAVGFNYRMTNLQAAVGCAQLERLGEFIAAKRRIQETYSEALAGIDGLSPPPETAVSTSSCWLSQMLCTREPDRVRAGLRARGVDSRSFWKPMHLLPPYAEAPRTDMPVSESLWTEVLVLPCSTHLGAEQQQAVIEAVKEELK